MSAEAYVFSPALCFNKYLIYVHEGFASVYDGIICTCSTCRSRKGALDSLALRIWLTNFFGGYMSVDTYGGLNNLVPSLRNCSHFSFSWTRSFIGLEVG